MGVEEDSEVVGGANTPRRSAAEDVALQSVISSVVESLYGHLHGNKSSITSTQLLRLRFCSQASICWAD